MKKGIYILAISTSIVLASCKGGSSENQGYDSGPTTESESGSTPSSGQAVPSDTTQVDGAGAE